MVDTFCLKGDPGLLGNLHMLVRATLIQVVDPDLDSSEGLIWLNQVSYDIWVKVPARIPSDRISQSVCSWCHSYMFDVCAVLDTVVVEKNLPNT